jgi:hypothetical protein
MLVVFLVVACAITLLALILPPGPAPVPLGVRGYVAYELSDELAEKFGQRSILCAVVAITNTSPQPITIREPRWLLLHRYNFGWEDRANPEPETSTWLAAPDTLGPGEGFVYEALVDENRPCRIGLDYEVHSTMPLWITEHVTCSPRQRRAMTDIIDLRNVKARSLWKERSARRSLEQ